MRKIMFSDAFGLTKAVLDGRKTMTRRVVSEKLLEAYYDYDDFVRAVAPRDIPYTRDYEREFFLRRARFEVGEVVAVAQSYKEVYWREPYVFPDFTAESPGWRNKMFVRADLMPHQIRITNIHVERLQDISDKDCIKEGILEDCPGIQYSYPTEIGYCGQYPFDSPRAAFAALIDKVSGKGAWQANPFVFVYEFELVK